ncbi:unnamed protein product, partial [Rotaria sp. Silwood2]
MDDMLETMYYDHGVGLAAVQVGFHKCVLTIDLQDNDDLTREAGFYPLFIVDPEIMAQSKELVIATEGCLSLPGQLVEVARAESINIQYLDYNNNRQELNANGWLARVIQHEMDHLEGKLLVDYLSTIKKDVALHSTHHKVVAVFTQLPKSQGRGLKEIPSPVHKVALQYNIPIYTPTTLRSKEIVNLITAIEAEAIIVVAYGFLIPKAILESKKYGCLNIHPSSLPRHRGAAPLQHTIIAGDRTTAVSIIQMDEGFDTGDIILQHSFTLPTRITLPLLQAQCATIGATLLLNVLDNIGGLPRVVQNTENVTYAPKLKKEEGKIDWCDTAYKIDCKIRGMNPWPGVYFEYN